jgi:hypothetical protein
VSESPLPSYAELLNDVAEIFGVLVDPAVVPAHGSLGEGELCAALERDAGTGLWGRDPVHAAYAVAAMNYHAALDQARAMAALMTGAFTAVPVMVLARSLIEVTSRAWWLLEPDIGAVARVERLQAARYASAVEGERTTVADWAQTSEFGLYTETTAQVQDYSQTLGLPLPSRKGRIYVCGEQRLPTARQRVIDMFGEIDVPGVYGLYSAFSHGEIYALWQGFQETTEPDGHRYYRPVVNEETIKGAVAVASWALYPPAARATALFGLNQSELEEWVDKHDAVLNPE